MTATDTLRTPAETLGFGHSLAAGCDVRPFLTALNAAAKERGICLAGPNDLLDVSLDLMLDEAAAVTGTTWRVIDHTLCLSPVDTDVSWPERFDDQQTPETDDD